MTVFKFQIMVIWLQLLLVIIGSVASNPTVFDQRQSGKTNVRVELKDAVIIAVGDGGFGGDYDYNYDYSDLTIKPGTPTSTNTPSTTKSKPSKSTTIRTSTAAPVSTTNANIIQNAVVVLEAENSSLIFSENNAKPGNGSSEPVKVKPSNAYKPEQIPVLILQEAHHPNKFLPVKTVEKQDIPEPNHFDKTNTTIISAKELPVRHCSPGFLLDDHNRCKRIRKPTRERPQLPIGFRFDHRPLIKN